MSRKTFAQATVLVLFLLASLAVPGNARAGGVCGGTYVVEAGQTLDSIAAMCGITVSAILAANPGIGTTVVPGQVLNLPGGSPITPIPVTVTPGGSVINSYNTYNNYYGYAPGGYAGIYIVRSGDTFAGIAYLYGVSVQALWAANPQIWNINYIYAGQVINVPPSNGQIVYPPWPMSGPTPTAEPSTLSYGTVPYGTPHGKIQLVNKSHADVYVSLQCTTKSGYNVINEYSVDTLLNVNTPAGWYVYVAWVGGRKFEGQFNLPGVGANRTITFYKDKVVVE